MATAHPAGCLAFLPRSYSGYSHLYESDTEDDPAPVPAAAVVVVGKDRKTFVVDRWMLQQEPLRVLLAVAGTRAVSSGSATSGGRRKKGAVATATARDSGSDEVIFVDVDEILFEHVLWLARNGDVCPDVLGMHLRDIIEFYAHEDS